MLESRVIPSLLLQGGLVVKTKGFRRPTYIGDPVNAVRIFNQKEVDELVLLDMDPCRGAGRPNLALVEEIATEAFMPVAYGGGVNDVATARALINMGIEKIILNSALARSTHLLGELTAELGSQAVVASIDYRTNRLRHRRSVVIQGGRTNTGVDPIQHARACAAAGAGEILLTCADRDGMMAGLDLATITEVSTAVEVPLIASGGVGRLADVREGLIAGASAIAASSLFVFHGHHKAVLITYPSRADLKGLVGDRRA